jgi:uncharacterized membrane protein SirB2
MQAFNFGHNVGNTVHNIIKIPTYFVPKHVGVYIYVSLTMMRFNNKARKIMKRDIYYCALSV